MAFRLAACSRPFFKSVVASADITIAGIPNGKHRNKHVTILHGSQDFTVSALEDSRAGIDVT